VDPVPDATETAPEPINSDRRDAHWDLRNAVRNYSTLVAAQVAVAVFSFASVWLVTKQIGTSGYGGVVAVIAASQVAQIFVNWTGISLARYGVEEFVETGRITESFWGRTAIFLPNTLIFLLFSWLWLPLLADLLKLPAEAKWLVAAHSVVSAVWLHIQYGMQAAKLPRLQGIMQAVERGLIFAAIVALVAVGSLDSLSAVMAYIAAPAVMTVAGLISIRKLFSWRIRVSSMMIRRLLIFSVPLIPYSLIGYFSTNYLDAIFIKQYLNDADLGVYSIAYQMNGILMQFPLLAGSLLLPLFVTLRSRGRGERVTEYLQDILPILTLLGALGAVAAAFVMQYFIPLVFSGDAHGAVIIFWILISSAAFAIPTLIGFAPYTNALSATYIASILAAVSSVVNLAANYFLIPVYGLKGCAWATVLAYGASVLVVILILRIKFSLRHRWTIPAFIPALAASIYASATGDLISASILAIVAAFVIVLIWHRAAVDGIRQLKQFRTVAFGNRE
jgi:O-antigen/teichoic acid export membrane protein